MSANTAGQNFCKCGCGKQTSYQKKKKKFADYIWGHNGKITHSFNKKLCLCGCGNFTNKENNYINGHNGRKYHFSLKCHNCNVIFESLNENKQYCSRKCYREHFTLSEETKRKLRIITINNIIKYRGFLPVFIGKNETKLLNEQEIKDNCKIERQYRINELGYVVDGYCKETNTVYEIYEPFHKNKIEKDLERQKQIQNLLNCKFIIIEDK